MTSSVANARLVWLAMGGLRKVLPPMLASLLLMAASTLWATDPPHNIATANSYGALNYCSTCHKIHGGVGGTLTTVSGNTNLCLSCHVTGGLATNKAFAASDQAVPAALSLVGSTAGGTSHRWDSSAAGRLIKGTPNTSTGTITPSGDYTGAYAATIKIQVLAGGTTGNATVSWSQTTNGTATFGGATTITTSTTAQALGTTGVSIAFSSTGTFVLNDIFYLYVRPDLVNPTSAMSTHLEGGKAMCSTCHDQHLQALAPFDPLASQTYTAGTTNNRHFQRVANDTGSLCGDCHSARNVGKGGTSHPVHVNLASAPNTKTPSASLVLNAAGNVECLSCHDIHKAPATTPTGMLLRVSNSTALCVDCHTLADTTTANTHTNPTTGILWPGDQYGGSTYPAYTLAADRGACKNCHTPHGWPDANNPGLKYGYALGARQDNLCETCHDSNGPSTKDVRSQITKANHHPVERTSGGRLVGCADCHNPHMAVAGVHTYATTADLNRNRIRTAAGANLIGALKGVDGVQFNYSGLGLWATPTAANFTKIAGGSPTTAASGAEFEYQVCFKCHTSYDSYGATRPGSITTYYNAGTAKFTNSSTTVTGTGTTWTSYMVGMYIQKNISSPAYRIAAFTSATSLTLASPYPGTTDAAAAAYAITRQQTDLAQEFSPANMSGHPVVTGLNNYTGSVAPKALSVPLNAPWNTNKGSQTMQCSDCHSTDAASPAAQGPHGSAAQFMLRDFGTGTPPPANWPAVKLLSGGLGALSTTVSSQSWCNNCHPLQTSTNDVHTRNSTHEGHFCYECHVVIPHGSKMSRLMGANTMPARYAYQNNPANMLIIQFKKGVTGSYATGNCYTSVHHSALSGTGVETW